MTNEEKLKFIQYNYVNSRASELIPPHEKEAFLRAWSEKNIDDCADTPL